MIDTTAIHQEREADDEAEQPYYGNIKPIAASFSAFITALF